MKVNEIRGYIFTAFALVSFIVSAPGWVSLFIGFGEVNFYYVIWVLLTLGFAITAVVCFVKAYNEIRYPGGDGKPVPGRTLYRTGQSWTEFNIFQLKLDKVRVHHNPDDYSCEAAFTAENWRPELKSGKNQMRLAFMTIGEAGNESSIASDTVCEEFIIEAGRHQQIPLAFTMPNNTERVLITTSVTFDDDDAIYKAQFEFYPGHYTR